MKGNLNPICPKCGSKTYKENNLGRYRCSNKDCRKTFSTVKKPLGRPPKPDASTNAERCRKYREKLKLKSQEEC